MEVRPSSTFVPGEDYGVSQKWQKLFGCCRPTTLTEEEERCHDVSAFINGRGRFYFGLTIGKTHSLILRSSDGTLAGVVDLDEGAVDKAMLAF